MFGLGTLFLVPSSTSANQPLELDIAGQSVGVLPNVDAATASQTNYLQNFATIIGNLLTVVMAIAAIILLLYLIWGAVEWISAGGDKGKLEKARGRITTAVIGILVLAASVALFGLIQQILGICVLNFWGAGCGA